MDLPKVKKRISNFLVKEEGRITKQSLVSMGAFLGSASLASVLTVKDVIAETSEGIGGMCCFAKGTMVTMSDYSSRPIESVAVGDDVLGFDTQKHEIVECEVLEIETPVRDHHYIMEFNNGKKLLITNDHPMYVKKPDFTGWAAIDKDAAEAYITGMDIQTLKTGDSILAFDGQWVDVVSIEKVDGEIQTYNLKKVSNAKTFFVEEFLTHNKDEDPLPSTPPPTPPRPPPCTVCCGNPDNDDQGHGVCDTSGDREPGEGCPIHKDALDGHKAYDENGTQIYFGTGRCDDDAKIFHFNGTEFAYAGNNLIAEHHHHGSHNSY